MSVRIIVDARPQLLGLESTTREGELSQWIFSMDDPAAAPVGITLSQFDLADIDDVFRRMRQAWPSPVQGSGRGGLHVAPAASGSGVDVLFRDANVLVQEVAITDDPTHRGWRVMFPNEHAQRLVAAFAHPSQSNTEINTRRIQQQD